MRAAHWDKFDVYVKETKIMKVAILGAGCYRTHAASGITNFTRACEVAEETGKEKIAMTHSTIEMGAELLQTCYNPSVLS